MEKEKVKKDRRMDGYKLTMLHDVRKILLMVIALILILHAVFGFSTVDGVSMLDTLRNGELVFYTRIKPAVAANQIVALRLPSGEYYIKRVIALGGDTVDLHDGRIYVNGVEEEGDYIRNETYPENSSVVYPYVVPEGDVFVLGDNRQESVDSRYFGSVNLRQIVGVIQFAAGWLYLRGV